MRTYLGQALKTEHLQVFAYLHWKWLAARNQVKTQFYFEEMEMEVREMTAWEASVAHAILEEGCRRVKHRRFRDS